MIHKYHSQNCNVQNLVSTFWLSQFNHYNEYFFSHGIDRHVYPLPNILKGANLITMICAVCMYYPSRAKAGPEGADRGTAHLNDVRFNSN